MCSNTQHFNRYTQTRAMSGKNNINVRIINTALINSSFRLSLAASHKETVGFPKSQKYKMGSAAFKKEITLFSFFVVFFFFKGCTTS